MRIAVASKFELAGTLTLVEKDNNMGLLELDNLNVMHRLLKWNGSFQESLHTSWDASFWPVEVVEKK